MFVSGIDILDGSPVLDIKPYIPEYDKPKEELAPPMCDRSSSGCHMTADVSNPFKTVRDSSVGCSLPDKNGQIFCNSGDTVQIRPDQNGQMFINSGDTVQTRVVLPYDSSSADDKDEISHVNHHYGILEGIEGKPDVMPDAVTVREKEYLCTESGDLGNSHVAKKAGEDIKASSDSGKLCNDLEAQTAVASWLLNPPVAKLDVTFTSQALEQLHKFSKQSSDLKYQFEMFSTPEEAAKSIADILREEPRSVYRRQHCQDSLYYFSVDVLHVTCWFDENIAQVVRIKPVASVPMLQPFT